MNMMTTATQTTPLDTFMLELPKTDTAFLKSMAKRMGWKVKSRAKNTPHLPCINFTLYAPRCGTCSVRSSLMKNGWDGLSLHNTSSIIVFT